MDFDDQLRSDLGTTDLDLAFKDDADRDAARSFMDRTERPGEDARREA